MNGRDRIQSGMPAYVTAMESAYGEPSQKGFGSAVFFDHVDEADALESAAQGKYHRFVADLWERFGEDAWMSVWKEVYRRPDDAKHDIQAELEAIEDADARAQVWSILNVSNGAEKARKALSDAYDAPEVSDLRAYNVGDGGAMSGILIAGWRERTGEATFLVFLLD